MTVSNTRSPRIYLIRHGETTWSLAGQHTGLTDLPLTAEGERAATSLRQRLSVLGVTRVQTSPLQRAARTCELAGCAEFATVDPDLMEWNYGRYEGRTTSQIREDCPSWDLFRDGCPDGESLAEIQMRVDRVVVRLRAFNDDVVVFSHGHFLRVLAARWLGLDATAGRAFHLDTTSISILGFEHGHTDPVIWGWNDTHHAQG